MVQPICEIFHRLSRNITPPKSLKVRCVERSKNSQERCVDTSQQNNLFSFCTPMYLLVARAGDAPRFEQHNTGWHFCQAKNV